MYEVSVSFFGEILAMTRSVHKAHATGKYPLQLVFVCEPAADTSQVPILLSMR